MLYQPLMMGKNPYFVKCTSIFSFVEHRHPEIELHYCFEGSYTLMIEKNEYLINAGDLVVIGSMLSHEIPHTGNNSVKALIIEAGPMLLSGYFTSFSQKVSGNPVFKLDKNEDKDFKNTLKETAMLLEESGLFSELLIKGNVFKICGYTLNKTISESNTDHNSKSLRSIANIEKALDMIHAHYNENLTLDEVAKLCGYSRSHFCKNFKAITGETFHDTLNNHRLKIACNLLKETNHSIESVATQTGFCDSKSFCRIFKQHYKTTPGKYRNENNKKSHEN